MPVINNIRMAFSRSVLIVENAKIDFDKILNWKIIQLGGSDLLSSVLLEKSTKYEK